MLSPIYSPGAIEEFVDLVVAGTAAARPVPPGLRGTTQRDHLMQED